MTMPHEPIHQHNSFTCNPMLDEDGHATNPYCDGSCPTPEDFPPGPYEDCGPECPLAAVSVNG